MSEGRSAELSGASYAPIAIFAYRRCDHLSRTLDALEACPEFLSSPVFVFSDGAKAKADAEKVGQVRDLVRSRLRSNMQIIEAPENRGLAASVIDGVTRLCGDYGKVIVIEDDLVVSPQTLTWLNAGLDRFADDEQVMQVSAYQWPGGALKGRETGLFAPVAVSWGWATWQRAWRHFDPTAAGWEELKTSRSLRRAFNVNDSYPFTEMLLMQRRGLIDSWAVRWVWTVFKKGGLVIYPPLALVENIGLDHTATNYSLGAIRRLFQPKAVMWAAKAPPILPEEVGLDRREQQVFQRALRRTGALNNRRIVAVLRALGLWKKN